MFSPCPFKENVLPTATCKAHLRKAWLKGNLHGCELVVDPAAINGLLDILAQPQISQSCL
jgi:hypothetical protein